MGIDDGGVVLAREVVEALVLEAVVAHLQRVAQRQLAALARQQLQERLEVRGIELLGAHELPVHRTQPVLELDDALGEEALHRFARFREHAAVGAEA